MNPNKMKTWHLILISLGILILPLVINFVILLPKFFPVVGDGSNWLSFWVTYISAIASFAMVLITWKTLRQNKEQLRQNKKQLNELKEHWEEETRPILYAEINQFSHTTVSAEDNNAGKSNDYRYLLTIENVGIKPASDVKLDLMFKDKKEDFMENPFYKKMIEVFDNIRKENQCIKGKDKIFITLLPVSKWQPNNTEPDFNNYGIFLNEFEKCDIVIKIVYDHKYEYNITFNIHNAKFLQTSTTEVLDYIRMSIDDLKMVIKKK